MAQSQALKFVLLFCKSRFPVIAPQQEEADHELLQTGFWTTSTENNVRCCARQINPSSVNLVKH